jgi:hypothetical protein
MWAEAILTRDDLEEVTRELFPLRILLGNDGNVLLSDRRDLALLPGVGLRMTISAELHWPVLGVHVPVSVRAATLEVRPEIIARDGVDTLAFKLHLDDIDVSLFPDFVDRGIVDLVNRELETKHVELSWGFTGTLSHQFALPDALASAGALDLRALSGRVKVTGEALALAVLFKAHVEPRGEAPAPHADTPPPPTPPPLPPRGLGRRAPSPVLVGVLGGLAMVAGAALHALVSRSRRAPGFLRQLRGLAS